MFLCAFNLFPLMAPCDTFAVRNATSLARRRISFETGSGDGVYPAIVSAELVCISAPEAFGRACERSSGGGRRFGPLVSLEAGFEWSLTSS